MDDKEILVPGSDIGIRLETRSGNRIPTLRPDPMVRDAVEEGDRIHRSEFPNIETRSLDSSYNCVGMVFAFRRAWVETEHVVSLLEDDEYHEVSRRDSMPGDLIVYYADEHRERVKHVGIIIEKSKDIKIADWAIRVISKWGRMGEYLHCEKDVPILFGTTCVYYSERK